MPNPNDDQLADNIDWLLLRTSQLWDLHDYHHMQAESYRMIAEREEQRLSELLDEAEKRGMTRW